MKKRILVIMAFGISFTPAVFAYDKLRDQGNGEMNFARIMAESPQAVDCNGNPDKSYGGTHTSSPQHETTTAGSAR